MQESGRKQWWYECSNPIFSSPCVLPGGNIAFGCVNGHVYVLDPLGHQVHLYSLNLHLLTRKHSIVNNHGTCTVPSLGLKLQICSIIIVRTV